jgi:hypothetical protein
VSFQLPLRTTYIERKGGSTTRPERRPMSAHETVTAIEHRCEALSVTGDIPPYRCTTSATTDRQGREVCASHAHAPRIRWFDCADE